MATNSKIYGRPKALEQGNKNFFLLIIFIATIGGIWFGGELGISAGGLYFNLTLALIAFLFVTMLWVDENNRNLMKQYIVTPFSSSPYLSMAGWLAGWITIPLMNFIGKIGIPFTTINFTTTQFFQSLYFSASGAKDIVAQNFSVAQLEASPFVIWYYSVIVAGTIEEFGWAFVLPIVFYSIALLLVQQVFKGKAPLGMKNENFYFIIAMIGSIGTFMFIHTLNASYVGVMFLVAGAFRFLMNSAVYVLGVTASYVIGVHQSNNNTAYIQTFGMDVWISAIFGNVWGLLIVFGFFLPAIVLVAFNYKRVWEDFKNEIWYRFRRKV